MSTKKISLAALAVIGLTVTTQASAVLLFDNGPDTLTNAFTINFGFSVTNPFTLGADSTLTGATFSNWLSTGETASNVDWAITTAAFGGTTVASGASAALTGLLTGTAFGSYDVYDQSFSLGSLGLVAGTYWLQLGQEATSNGVAGYWGASGSLLDAWQTDGTDTYMLSSLDPASHSTTFRINGDLGLSNPNQPNPNPAPEPATLALLGMGLVGLGAMRRRAR